MQEGTRSLLEKSIDELNQQRPDEEKIPFSIGMQLIGAESTIDSMELVTLIAIVEDNAEDDLDVEISLLSDKAFSQGKSPFKTIETLGDYIDELIREGNNA